MCFISSGTLKSIVNHQNENLNTTKVFVVRQLSLPCQMTKVSLLLIARRCYVRITLLTHSLCYGLKIFDILHLIGCWLNILRELEGFTFKVTYLRFCVLEPQLTNS